VGDLQIVNSRRNEMLYHNGSNGSNRSMRRRRSGGTPPPRAMRRGGPARAIRRGGTTGRARTRSSSSSNLNNTNEVVRGTRFTGNPVRRYTSPNGINRFGGTRTTTKAKTRRAAIKRDTGNQMKKNIPNNFTWVGKFNPTTGKIDDMYCPPGTMYLDKTCRQHTGKELKMQAQTNYLHDPIANKRTNK
jgi:hypothetical protein